MICLEGGGLGIPSPTLPQTLTSFLFSRLILFPWKGNSVHHKETPARLAILAPYTHPSCCFSNTGFFDPGSPHRYSTELGLTLSLRQGRHQGARVLGTSQHHPLCGPMEAGVHRALAWRGLAALSPPQAQLRMC